MSKRPFEVDQAAGLRQLFAAQQRNRLVVGFIGTGHNTVYVISEIASELTKMGRQCVLVDEHPSPTNSGAHHPNVRFISHPKGEGLHLSAPVFDHADFILAAAYPSVHSAIHHAEMLVIVESAPLTNPETTRKILRATRRLAERTALLLTHRNDKKAALVARLDVERLSTEETGHRIQWLGAIPMQAGAHDLSANAAAMRLTQWQPAPLETA